MINAVGDFEPSATTQNVAVEEVISCKGSNGIMSTSVEHTLNAY